MARTTIAEAKKTVLAAFDVLGPRLNQDPEADHVAADEALSAFVRALGHTDVADAYDKLREEFWYA